MKLPPLSDIAKKEALAVDNWPMSLRATQSQLKKAQTWLERYRAALRLADIEIKRRNQGIISLTTFVHQSNNATDTTNLLKLALVQALNTSDAQMGAIVLIDAESKALTLGVHKGVTTELSQILTGQYLGAGATALMPHLVAGDGALLECHTTRDATERQLLAVSRLTSLVSLPLQLGPKLMGAFLVGLSGQRTFRPAELYFLMALSQETTMALENLGLREGLWFTAEALLGDQTNEGQLHEVAESNLNLALAPPFALPDTPIVIPNPAKEDLEHLLSAIMEAEEEVQQHYTDLQTLNNLVDSMNRSLDLKQVLQYAVDQTQTILTVDAAWLYMINSRNQLKMQAHTGLSDTYVRGMHCLELGDSLEGQVAAENSPHFVEAISDQPNNYKIWVDKEGLQALIAVPIIRPERQANHTEQAELSNLQVVGVLAAGMRTPQGYPWSPRDMRLLTSIANQLALTIDNARLYARVQESETNLKAGNEVLREINQMLLEKNSLLEKFVSEHLVSALKVASRVLQHLRGDNTPSAQKQNVALLQKIITRLNQMAQEIYRS